MMTIEQEPDSDLTTHHPLLDWLEESISFLPSFLNEPYCIPDATNGHHWYWDHDQAQDQQAQPFNTAATTSTITASSTASISVPSATQPELPKKRKQLCSDPAIVDRTNQSQRRRTSPGCDDEGDGDEDDADLQRDPPATIASRGKSSRKSQYRSGGSNTGNIGSKDVRWAEQLLNPCAMAIESKNPSRVQHLICVLRELASPTGDANQRLVTHGLRALTQHISNSATNQNILGFGVSTRNSSRWGDPPTFASTEPRLFRSALIRFQEVSPWFAFPNSLANASIVEAASADPRRKLHIVDIGVSHGVQWPTLLEALARRPGRAPPLVRITTVATGDGGEPPAPFAAAPPGYDYSSHLLRYAKSINLNLEIRHARALESLLSGSLAAAGGAKREETLVVCSQFRLHQLRHEGAEDEQAAALASIRDMAPDLLVLCEVEGECCCRRCCGVFTAGFGRRVEFLWTFLDSTSAAFKGRECGERRLMEGEAARALVEGTAVAAGVRQRWREKVAGMGFREERFCEDALDAGRALLRKYDGNWEMQVAGERTEQGSAAPGGGAAALWLCWKGRPVSCCSLWKL